MPQTDPFSNLEPVIYTVKAGDTLSHIARNQGNGMSYQDLAKYNGIANPNKIRVGQKIRIPVSGDVAHAPQQQDRQPQISDLFGSDNVRTEPTSRSGNDAGWGTNYSDYDIYHFADEEDEDAEEIVLPQSTTSRPSQQSTTAEISRHNEPIDNSFYPSIEGNNQFAERTHIENTDTPQSIKDKIKPMNNSWVNVKEMKDISEKVTSFGDNRLVVDVYQKMKNPDQKYIVVDKMNDSLYLCQNGNVLNKYTVGYGVNGRKIDDLAYTVVKDGKLVNMAGNGSTGAGLFYATPSYYHGHNSLMLQTKEMREKGETNGIPTAIHYSERHKGAVSNGCVRMGGKEIDQMIRKLGREADGTPVYILPVREENKFKIVGGKFQFVGANQGINHSKGRWDDTTNDWNKIPEAYDDIKTGKGGKVYKNETVNYDEKDYKSRPLMITYNYQVLHDAVDPGWGQSGPNKEVIDGFIKGLTTNKSEIMKDFGLDNFSYDELSRCALGILGAESSFGSENNWVRDTVSAGAKLLHVSDTSADYKYENSMYNHLNDLQRSLFSSVNDPNNNINEGIESAKDGWGRGHSIGLTQINYDRIISGAKKGNNETYIKEAELFKKYGIEREDLTYDPAKAAIATMIFLGCEFNNQGRSSSKAIKAFNPSETYLQTVRGYADLFDAYELFGK